MPLPADQELAACEEPPCGRREAVEAVFADADDGEPAGSAAACRRWRAAHGGLMANGQAAHAGAGAGRHDRSGARWPRASPARPISTPCCRWPAAPSSPAGRRSRRASAASAACGPGGVSAPSTHRRRDRRHASLRRADVAPRRRGLRAARRAAARPHPAGLDAASEGDRWIEVEDMRAAPSRRSGPRRDACSSPSGRLTLPAFAAAPQHRYVVRTIEAPARARRACPMTVIIRRAGPFGVEDEWR